jgi:hypothetical protein
MFPSWVKWHTFQMNATKEARLSIVNKKRQPWNAALFAVSIGLLASCTNLQSLPTAPQARYDYAVSVAVKPGDTAAALEQQYAGRVLVWHPESSFAILGTNTAPTSTDPAVTGITSNRDAQSAPEINLERMPVGVTPASATNVGGWAAWGGGWTAWSGGWTAWSGGWTAWSGGTNSVPTLPSDNRARFLQIKLPQGQALSRQFGQGIKVAVIDTGIDLNHPMFQGRLAPSSEWMDYVDFDMTPQEVQPASGTSAYGHGTAVAGLILQVAPKATILPIRVLGPDGSGDTTNVVAAIDWAIQKGAKVINLSLGTTVNDSVLQAQVNYATSLGVYVVASAGNTGDTKVTYPAGWAKSGSNSKYLLSVGSVSQGLAMSTFSCSGTALEFVALGEFMYSAAPDNRMGYATGTSFAAPQVAGSVALALSDTATANRGNMESYLSSSAQSVAGYALVNVAGLEQKLPDFQKRKALFVAPSSLLGTGESAMVSTLQGIGYAVTVVDDDVVTTASATGQDVIVISPAVDETKVSTKFNNTAVPVVAMGEQMFENLRMVGTATSDHGTITTQTQIGNLSGTHPLAAGLTGNVTVLGSAKSLDWGNPAASAVKVASSVGDSSKVMLFGYVTGAQMVGLTAPARRVGFFYQDTSLALNATGKTLFESAVTWALTGN